LDVPQAARHLLCTLGGEMALFAASMYIIIGNDSMPVLVKFDDLVSYLPVFETKAGAKLAATNLKKGAGEKLQISSGSYTVCEFSWEFFREHQLRMKNNGVTLFIYPMAPSDYGAA
jgi:hypothetical protein